MTIDQLDPNLIRARASIGRATSELDAIDSIIGKINEVISDVVSPTSGTVTRIVNVHDYGAIGDGVADDTAAIQAAIDYAATLVGVSANPTATGAIVYIPASDNAYMFSNLKLPSYTNLMGAHMSETRLKRIAGSTGTAIREKTAAEGNPNGAQEIWIRNLNINGNSTTGDGIDLGNSVVGKQFETWAGMENVLVTGFTSGVGMKLAVNAISLKYIYANSNQDGIWINSGQGGMFHSVFAEGNSRYQLRVSCIGASFFGVQLEDNASASPCLYVDGSGVDNSFTGVYINLGINKNELIWNATNANKNMYRDVFVSTNAHTFTHAVYNESWGIGTGSAATHVLEFAIGQDTIAPRWYINQSTGKTDLQDGDSKTYGGSLALGGYLQVRGGNANAAAAQAAAFETAVGRDGSGTPQSTDKSDIALQYGGANGGFRHWISTWHNAAADAGNRIRFSVNTGATAAASSAPGTGNVAVVDLLGTGGALFYGTIQQTSEVAPAQITSNQNDYSPPNMATAAVLLLTTDASRDVTGFATGTSGRWLWVYNNGSFNLVLKHQNASSSATNRIVGRGGADVTLTPNTGVQLYYSPSLSRWIVMTDTL